MNGSFPVVSRSGKGIVSRRSGPRMYEVLYREGFNMNKSNILFMRPSSITSVNCEVFGPSKDRTRVYNGNVEYFNSFICEGNVLGRRGVAIRAETKVGAVRVALSGSRPMLFGISVNLSAFGARRIPVASSRRRFLSNRLRMLSAAFGTATVDIKGPRTVVFISSISTVSVSGCNPTVRTRRMFPRGVGMRFIRMVSGGRNGVEA